MKKRSVTVRGSSLVFILYITLISYVLIAILKLHMLDHFEVAMAYEILGFMTLAYFIFSGLHSNPVKTEFCLPLLMTTLVYNILLNLATMFLMIHISPILFFFIHFTLLLFYTLVVLPLYIMGRR